LNPTSTNSYRMPFKFSKKYGKQFFYTKVRLPNFPVFSVKLHGNLLTICTCLFRKFPSLFFYHGLSWKKNFLAILGPKLRTKNPKMAKFKANFRLVKRSYCPKIILTYNIWTFIGKNVKNLAFDKASQNSRCVFLCK
jgi:hypothetical protein